MNLPPLHPAYSFTSLGTVTSSSLVCLSRDVLTYLRDIYACLWMHPLLLNTNCSMLSTLLDTALCFSHLIYLNNYFIMVCVKLPNSF